MKEFTITVLSRRRVTIYALFIFKSSALACSDYALFAFCDQFRSIEYNCFINERARKYKSA